MQSNRKKISQENSATCVKQRGTLPYGVTTLDVPCWILDIQSFGESPYEGVYGVRMQCWLWLASVGIILLALCFSNKTHLERTPRSGKPALWHCRNAGKLMTRPGAGIRLHKENVCEKHNETRNSSVVYCCTLRPVRWQSEGC